MNCQTGRRERSVSVDWHDLACSVPVMAQGRGAGRSQPPLETSHCPKNRCFPSVPPVRQFGARKPDARFSVSGFTLVEMLVVIAIIAILASMVLSALAGAKRAAYKNRAKIEMSQIVAGVEQYDQQYGRFPVSANAQNAAAASATGNTDFTYGGTFPSPAGPVTIGTTVSLPGNSANILTNDEVIAILMDFTNYPGSSNPTINTNYSKNPMQTQFLNAKMNTDPTLGGVGPDLVYRDPWGNPYVITMDVNYDGECNDVFYGTKKVSSYSAQTGLNGLFNNVDVGGNGNHFQYHGKVMVWSAGPTVGSEKGIDPEHPANVGVNKNHVISWQ